MLQFVRWRIQCTATTNKQLIYTTTGVHCVTALLLLAPGATFILKTG